ncbi:MAG: hypothetical protein EON59_02620 [Alphaproteobacteria bacterium]|nr:MAG: hypothetical protein EON59_02620 [Alphaproteobacteria bacterium]
MKPRSFTRRRFPADVVRHVVWPYFRFDPRFSDGEALLTQRGIDAFHEANRCWPIKIGLRSPCG